MTKYLNDDNFLAYMNQVRNSIDSIVFHKHYLEETVFKESETELELIARCWNTGKSAVEAARFIERLLKKTPIYNK